MTLKPVTIAAITFLSFGCKRPAPTPAFDARAPVVPPAFVDASVTVDAGPRAALTIDAYCTDFVSRNDVDEGFSCLGAPAHATCTLTEKKPLPTLGAVVLVDERSADGTRNELAIVDKTRHFAMLAQVRTEVCDIGDPADVSLKLVSAGENSDADQAGATIVIDSIRIDPPFQGGPQPLTAARVSIHCRAGAIGPECDKPETLGTFDGPLLTNYPPPFSKWKKK